MTENECHFSKPYVELHYKRSNHHKIKTRNKNLFKEGKKGDIDQMKFHCLDELISKFPCDLDLQNVVIHHYHMQLS